MARFLVVDDNESIVDLYIEILEEEGHEVVAIAFDGEQAVEIMAKLSGDSRNLPEIVLMDYRLPGIDGLEAMKKILVIIPDCKVIIISGDCSIKEKAIELGAILFVEKPIDFSVLLTAVDHHAIA